MAIKKIAITFMAILILFASCKKESSPKPVADFTFIGAGTAPVDVTFTNNSTNALTYSWSFGDGAANSTDRNPTHTYTKAGTFTVTLTATGNDGTTSTKSKTIIIQAPTSVKISSIKVSAMPFTDGSGSAWDLTSGPDVFMTLTDGNDNVLQTSGTATDVTTIPPVLAWNLNPAYQVTNFSATYKVLVWDFDTPDPNDFIGGYSFTLGGFTTNGYPATVSMQTPGSSLKIDLTLQWQ